MTRLYQDCLLVHADLSPYNMLWFNDLLYFIDVSQAVDTAHPQSNQFLLRDCRNVTEVDFIEVNLICIMCYNYSMKFVI